jgi:hypothetical protein
MMTDRVRMVNSRGTLESLRHIGITLEEGITELVDNAVDAGATNIQLVFFPEKGTQQPTLLVADDGVGIPEAVPGSEVVNTVQHVLRFGGKIPHHGRPIPIGKYGFGLSQTAAGLSLRTEVSSKVNGGEWRTCVYDLEQLRADRGYLPPEVKEGPNTYHLFNRFHNPNSGTVVRMTLKDDLGDTSEEFYNRMAAKLGRIYRSNIAAGLTIEVNNSNIPTPVPLRDPLAQLPGAVETLLYGKQELYVDDVLTFDGQDMSTFPVIPDKHTGAPAQIRLRMVAYDLDSITKAVLDGKVESTNHPAPGTLRRLLGREGFNPKGQGFSVVRSGREIKHGQSLGIYTKHESLNYFKGEIQFPAALDHLFNVQVIKGRYTIDKRLRDVLAARYKSTINQMKKQATQQRARRAAQPKPSKLPRAESRTVGMRKTLQRRAVSPSLRQRKLEELAQKKQSVIAAVDKEEDAKVAKIKEEIANAPPASEKTDALKIKFMNAELNAEAAKKEVRRRFENEAFMRKIVKPLPGGDLYAVEDFDDEIWVTINSESDFFRSMYARAAQHANEQDLLDLMIFAIAYAEAEPGNSGPMTEFWQETRQTVSQLAHLFVSIVNQRDPVEPEAEVPGDDEADEEAPETHVQLSLTDAFGGGA